MLNETPGRPLYLQLEEELAQKIMQGAWKPGSQMPTELALCEGYGVSRSTVRKAVALLVEKGLATVVHGKGTFVAAAKKEDGATFSSTSQYSMQVYGRPLKSKVLQAGLQLAEAKEREFLALPAKETQVVAVRRLRFLDEAPFCLETILLPMAYLELLREDFTGSLYGLLERQYGVHPAGGHRTFEAGYPAPEDAEACGLKDDAPQLLITDYVRDQNGAPLHITKRVHFEDSLQTGISPQEFLE